MEDKMETTDNWDGFGSQYLMAENVKSETDEFVIVGVSSKFEEGKGNVLHLELEGKGLKKLFGCNKTNEYAVKEVCKNSPKEAIGKTITFFKVKVQKPGTSPPQYVDGLRLKFKKEPSKEPEANAGVNPDGTI